LKKKFLGKISDGVDTSSLNHLPPFEKIIFNDFFAIGLASKEDFG